MTVRSIRGLALGHPLGALVAMVLVLAGLFAMHGLTPTSSTGAHHHPPTHTVAVSTEAAHQDAVPVGDNGSHGRDGRGMMTGCIVVLGAIAGAVLALVARSHHRRSNDGQQSDRTPNRVAGLARGRPPPRRLLLTALCVIRV